MPQKKTKKQLEAEAAAEAAAKQAELEEKLRLEQVRWLTVARRMLQTYMI
jgi:hypothetical protein